MNVVGWLILAAYVVGYLTAVAVIYEMLARQQLQKINKHQLSGYVNELSGNDVIASAAGASLLGLGWFLALPWLTAYTIRRMRRPTVGGEQHRLAEDYRSALELRNLMEQSRKALARETSATHHERGSSAGWEFDPGD